MIPAQLKSRQEQDNKINEIQTVEELNIVQQYQNIVVIGQKINNIVVITVEGNGIEITQYWKPYYIAAIVGYKSDHHITSVFTNQNGECGDLYIAANTNGIYINYRGVTPTAANSWIRGQLVFTV